MIKKRIYFWRYIPNFLNYIKKEYKNRLNDYFYVYIFDTREKMYEYVDEYNQKCGENIDEHDYNALTKAYCKMKFDKDNNMIMTGNHGIIFFFKECTTAIELTHETGHIVINYFDYIIKEKKDLFGNHNDDFSEIENNNHDIEELFCYMSGYICNSINAVLLE